MKYRAILAGPSGLSIERRSALLGVSKSGFYAWCHRPLCRRAQVNAQLVVEMRRIHVDMDRTYGSPRMAPELTGRGLACGRHRAARLMRAHGIRAKAARRFVVTTSSQHGYTVAPNLLARQFAVRAPNRVWMSDITYILTAYGWCYLAVVLDAYSRRVVGWAVSLQLNADLPLAALHRALASRRPGPGLLHHSDRGIQYASVAYQDTLRRYGIRCSMSRRGDCWDNAVVESFFHSLKVERLHSRRLTDRQEVCEELQDYIERFYNRERRHSTLGHISPVLFELRNAA